MSDVVHINSILLLLLPCSFSTKLTVVFRLLGVGATSHFLSNDLFLASIFQTINDTTQPATVQEHYQNRTRGLSQDFTPHGTYYDLQHVEQILSPPCIVHDSGI